MSIRVTSKTLDEAKQRLKAALENMERTAQSQLAALERDLLEAKAAKLAHETELQELQQMYSREKTRRETAGRMLAEVNPRLDQMSNEILTILKSAGVINAGG